MKYLALLLLLLSGFTQDQPDTTATSEAVNSVAVIRVDGSISPTTTNYIDRGIKEAREMGAEALILELDTRGGLLESTKNIVQSFLDSEDLPIIVYVSPEGGSATSAGTFITMAAHIAAMAPATTIGAASPVQMGGGQQDTVMQKKIFNYSESFIENIAKERNRNAEWAKSAVSDGEAITETEALELNVIDLIASDLTDLLDQIDGQEVEGKILETSNATIEPLDESFAEKFFSFIMRPEI